MSRELQDNRLNGTLPSELGDLTTLESLYVQHAFLELCIAAFCGHGRAIAVGSVERQC